MIGADVTFQGGVLGERAGQVWSLGPDDAIARWVIPYEPLGNEIAVLCTLRGIVLQIFERGGTYREIHRRNPNGRLVYVGQPAAVDEKAAQISIEHSNGVHVRCGTDCKDAGKVARFHGHDYDGPLICGCDEVDS